MSFDFHITYAGHSNVQLLAIVLQKELYDEAAVQAAEAILKTRVVTEEDKAAAEAVILQLGHQEQRRIEQREELANKVNYTIRGIFFPVGKPVTWFLKVFSVVCFVLWIVHIIRPSYYYPGFFSDMGILAVFIILTEAYYLIMLYWVFRINKKGWMLAIIFYIVELVMSINNFFTFYKSQWLYPGNESALVIQTVLTSALLYYFNRKDVRTAFGVSRVLYRDILIVGAVLALLFTIVPRFA